MSMTADLQTIVGGDSVGDGFELLERYSADFSFAKPCRPNCVVFATTTEQVQRVLRYANERSIPVTPRSSAVSFFGGSIPTQGGIVLDLTRMNRVLEVDQRNRSVKVEPGVTWAQVQEYLRPQGLMVCSALFPHPARSVLTSAMEREPILIPKSEYSEVLLTAELVLANGDLFWTGTAMAKGMKGQVFPDGLIPGTRLFLGSQGCLGVLTWAKLKVEPLPAKDRLFFIPGERLQDIVEPAYRIQRRMIGSECFVLNRHDLATVLADRWPEDFHKLKRVLPAWTIILCLSGLKRLPEERIRYEEAALKELSYDMGFETWATLPGVPGSDVKLLGLLRRPWRGDTYWKFLYKGGCREVFFHVTLNRVAGLVEGILKLAVEHDYVPGDIGIYVQPIDRARVAFCRLAFYCGPGEADDVGRVQTLQLAAGRLAMNSGALFTTPYGPLADMVYSRAGAYAAAMKVVKDAFDPNHILNPGKLCF